MSYRDEQITAEHKEEIALLHGELREDSVIMEYLSSQGIDVYRLSDVFGIELEPLLPVIDFHISSIIDIIRASEMPPIKIMYSDPNSFYNLYTLASLIKIAEDDIRRKDIRTYLATKASRRVAKEDRLYPFFELLENYEIIEEQLLSGVIKGKNPRRERSIVKHRDKRRVSLKSLFIRFGDLYENEQPNIHSRLMDNFFQFLNGEYDKLSKYVDLETPITSYFRRGEILTVGQVLDAIKELYRMFNAINPSPKGFTFEMWQRMNLESSIADVSKSPFFPIVFNVFLTYAIAMGITSEDILELAKRSQRTPSIKRKYERGRVAKK